MAGVTQDVDQAGRTPLHYATIDPPVGLKNIAAQTNPALAADNARVAKEYRVTNTTRLLEAGADVNAANTKGETPLYKAVRNTTSGAVPITRLLLSHGADANAQLSNGSSPLSFVRRSQRPGVVELFADLL